MRDQLSRCAAQSVHHHTYGSFSFVLEQKWLKWAWTWHMTLVLYLIVSTTSQYGADAKGSYRACPDPHPYPHGSGRNKSLFCDSFLWSLFCVQLRVLGSSV